MPETAGASAGRRSSQASPSGACPSSPGEACPSSDGATPNGATPGGGCAAGPTPRQLELLAQWNDLQSGFQRLTDQVLGDVEARTGLAASSFQALWFLLTSPGCAAPMGQLASTLGFTTAGTTGLADRLACAGLLERRPDPGDRRVTLAALTEEGQRAACAAGRMLADTLAERLVPRLGPDGLAGLAATLGSLAPDPRR